MPSDPTQLVKREPVIMSPSHFDEVPKNSMSKFTFIGQEETTFQSYRIYSPDKDLVGLKMCLFVEH